MEGEKLKAIRIKRKHTQKSLAEAIGSDRTYINSIENGTKNPSIALLTRIAKELNCSIGDFFN